MDKAVSLIGLFLPFNEKNGSFECEGRGLSALTPRNDHHCWGRGAQGNSPSLCLPLFHPTFVRDAFWVLCLLESAGGVWTPTRCLTACYCCSALFLLAVATMA